MSIKPLDLDYVRQQFPQLHDDAEFIFASNAGGSYVCQQVNGILERYNRHTRVQPYNRFPSAIEAGEAMDRAYARWADALCVDREELTLGPSTSINTYVMAQAMGGGWQAGDEIIVTNQDHEANSGVWRRKAHERGVVIKEWQVEGDTGLLNPDDLLPLLSDRTRWVFFTHCSNIVGTANPVASIVDLIRSNSQARVMVDAVAYAPHHLPDLKALGVDAYVFSLYKVYGPHQGLLYVSEAVREELSSQAHYFNVGNATQDFQPSGPQHAQIAGSAGVIDYFDELYAHHYDSKPAAAERFDTLHQMISQHEAQLCNPILDYLGSDSNFRVLGKKHTRDDDRAPTIAFKHARISSFELCTALQAEGIGTEHGNFYAHRLINDLGFDADDGVVRLSLLHYNTLADSEHIVAALDRSLQALQ